TQTLDPSQIFEWEVFVEQEIKEMFAPESVVSKESGEEENKEDHEESKPEDKEENCLGELTYKELRKYFENPEKLKELLKEAKDYFIQLGKETKEAMESKELEFKLVKINSTWRSTKTQVDILVEKLDHNKNMYEYYKTASLSAPYLKIIQDRYNGQENNNFQSIVTAYDSSKYADRNGVKRAEIFQSILKKYPVNKGDKTAVYNILTESMVTIYQIPNKYFPNNMWREPLFNPSYHVFGDENNKASQALDIEVNSSTKEMYNIHIKRKGGYLGNNHYHLTYY
ncbi:MAG: hypothetical protein ACRCWI_08805, partial [Brevinema sp.]